MDKLDIISIFTGISQYTKRIIAHKLNIEFATVLLSLNKFLSDRGLDKSAITPPINLIMNAFRLCDLSTARIVIFGQDPYKSGEAIGLSFAAAKGRPVPPSLKNIYKCLVHCGLMTAPVDHGDLTNWATQGVLLLNCAMTTVLGESNAHAEIWKPYTTALIGELNALPQQLIFILLGQFAQEKRSLISPKHMILEWGHPSPLNSVNNTLGPKNFLYCDVFIKANDALISRGEMPVIWDLNRTQEAQIDRVVFFDTAWLFTDGGSSNNGKANCIASWAYCICNEAGIIKSAYGIVDPADVRGEVFKSSNNRGELSAIYKGLAHMSEYKFTKLIIVSDSEYSINCIDKWAANWIDNPEKLADKKNLDIILPAFKLLDTLRTGASVEFKHIRSHRHEPDDIGNARFLWKYNNFVDSLCNKALGR